MSLSNEPDASLDGAPADDPALERSIAAAFYVALAGMALTTLDGHFLVVNDRYCDFVGYSRDALTGGMSIADVTHPDDRPPDRDNRATALHEGLDGYRLEKRYIRGDGEVVWGVVHVSVIRDETGAPVHLLGMTQEITATKQLQDDLTRLALHDPLTGLANRTLLDDRLRTALARSSRLGTLTGVLFLDLDGFKAINDRHGHHVGDELLRAVAGRLTSVLRPADVVARLGGDEFVAICEELSGLDEAYAIAARVEAAVAEAVVTDAGPLMVTASVGLALAAADDEVDADELVRRADEAMYRAKQAGTETA